MMQVASAQLLRSTETLPPGVPLVRCLGDTDDHFRLLVLLVSALRDDGDGAAAQTCLEPGTPWSRRLDAFDAFLASLRAPARPFLAAIEDVDALDVAPADDATLWDDASFRRERSEVLARLVHATERSAWLLARPFPRASLSVRLAHISSSEETLDRLAAHEPRPQPAWTEIAKLLPASLRPIGEALLRERKLSVARLRSLANRPEDAAAGLIDAALGAVSRQAAATAPKIAAIREDLPRNGGFGPFRWGTAGPLQVLADDVDVLCSWGLLEAGAALGTWRMLRAARQRIGERLTPAQRAVTVEIHRLLAADPPGERPDQWIETHRHAVLAGLDDRAIATARYYGGDLRELARARSLAGRFADAARIYQSIVERFDGTDAYAWEYLGFNLARAHAHPTPPVLDQIDEAFRTAHLLSRSNPLFHGRWIGFQFEHRGAQLEEADRWCAFYRQASGRAGLEWFGWQIVAALARTGRREEADRFADRWSIQPPEHPERRVLRRTFGSAKDRTMVMTDDFDAPLPEFELAE